MTPVVGRVRARLLAAFLALLGTVVLLGATGWIGMHRIQGALSATQDQLLPDTSRALDLSERAVRLAGTAPKLGNSPTPLELKDQRAILESLLVDIDRDLAGLQHPTPELQRVVARLREGVTRQLPALVRVSERKQTVRTLLERRRERLDLLGQALHGASAKGDDAVVDPRVSALWSSLVLGTAVDDPAALGRLEADAEALSAAISAHGAARGYPAAAVSELFELSRGPNSVLALRHEAILLEPQVTYLVGQIHGNAQDLAEEASRYVAQLRALSVAQNDRLRVEVRRGFVAMLLLTLASLVIAVLATRYVGRLVGDIERITRVMSRLAAGDTAQQTPAVSRQDEIGALARNFEVFRDHLVAKQHLVLELHAQSELLEAVHHHLTDGLAVFDRDQRLLLWNVRLVDLFAPHGVVPALGMRPAELLASLGPGVTWSVPGQPQRQPLAPGIEALWTEALAVELQLPDGHVIDLRSCRMPGGGLVTLATDLTARRAIEGQLQQAQKMEVLGQLTGGVAHDFNNYLGTILGNLALLEASVGDGLQARTQWQRVRRAATSAAGLTRRLLAFARRQPLQAEEVLLDEMVEEMRDLIEYSAGEHVNVVLSLDAPGSALLLDRGQLENALLNLVMNSGAALPRGGTIEIRTWRGTAPEGVGDAAAPWARVEVRDDGVGMSPAQLAQAVEPFYTTKAPGQGSGLGLSIVYGFVRQSGGQIALESTAGQGTRVTLAFPSHAPVATGSPGDARSPERASLDACLLLVDDDEAFRATLAEQLRALGVDVDDVATPEAALAALDAAARRYAALVTDIRLAGGQSGIALAAAVRVRWPSLPVITMSGQLPELAPRQAGQAAPEAANDWPFLQKPFDIGALMSRLQGSTPTPPAETAAPQHSKS